MIIAVLVFLGLCLGSFVNALVWRIHEQSKKSGKSKKASLSIANGRSMCPECRHKLSSKDLIPVLSWVNLRGKCRYCSKPISMQYPLVELITALLFAGSYIWWPNAFVTSQIVLFGIWLILVAGFMALSVYDLRWYLLPNRIMTPLAWLAGLFAVISVYSADAPFIALINTFLAVFIGGGIFYLLFQLSGGKWIGGGDVKLGWLLGLIAGTPARSLMFIFIASILGTLVSLPLLASKRLKKTNVIPFGPFLIAGLIITQLFGVNILEWYQHLIINL
jgi:prepilin signal peptidase PulO-like enzyme (type II secretory pathway)